MLEAGLAVIVACLPTLNFLFGKAGPATLMRSIRSMLSLHSIRSNHSNGSGSNGRKYGRQLNDNDTSSTSSAAGITKIHDARGSGVGVETHVMRDLEAQHPPMPRNGQIAVHSEMDQEYKNALG